MLRALSWFCVPPHMPAIFIHNHPSVWILWLFWTCILSDLRPCRACEGGAGCRWVSSWLAPMWPTWCIRLQGRYYLCDDPLCAAVVNVLMNELIGPIAHITSVAMCCTFGNGGSVLLMHSHCGWLDWKPCTEWMSELRWFLLICAIV
jgi:hypothetical protein